MDRLILQDGGYPPDGGPGVVREDRGRLERLGSGLNLQPVLLPEVEVHPQVPFHVDSVAEPEEASGLGSGR